MEGGRKEAKVKVMGELRNEVRKRKCRINRHSRERIKEEEAKRGC